MATKDPFYRLGLSLLVLFVAVAVVAAAVVGTFVDALILAVVGCVLLLGAVSGRRFIETWVARSGRR